MRLPMKPSQLPDTTLTLPMRLPSANAASITAGAVWAPRTISSSFMMCAGLKKCRPRTCCGRRSHRGDGVDVQCRRIACQNGFRFEQAVQFAEDGLLEFEVFVDGFDDQVDITDGRIIGGRRDPRDAGIRLGLIDAFLSNTMGVGVRYGGQCLFKHLRIVIDPLHRHPGVGQAHDNAAAHGARADDGCALNIERCLAHVLFSCWRSEDSLHHSQPPRLFEIYSCDEQHSADGCAPPDTD